MPEAIEARTDEYGQIRFPELTQLPSNRRILVVVLDEPPSSSIPTATVPSKQRGAAGPSNFEPSAHSAAPSTGAVRYRIDRVLAEGGMGRAYVGTDLQTGRPVCIKQLRAGFSAELLVHEWRSLSRVTSGYVARYLDRYDHGGTLHLVMEYIDGPTLSHRLKSGFSLNECVWLGLALMRGVGAFHEVGVIHCDLKPQNVLIQDVTVAPGETVTWVPKIIDFGIAILDGRDANNVQTREGAMAGTPAYMAPEQCRGLMLAPACDVYAVGVILWEALVGRTAYTGSMYEIMAAKMPESGGLKVETDRFHVPSVLAELVEHCTHPNAGRRPSAEEAARRLEPVYASLDTGVWELD